MASADPQGVTRRFHAQSWTPVAGFPFTVDADWWPHRRGSYPPEPAWKSTIRPEFWGWFQTLSGTHFGGSAGVFQRSPWSFLTEDRGYWPQQIGGLNAPPSTIGGRFAEQITPGAKALIGNPRGVASMVWGTFKAANWGYRLTVGGRVPSGCRGGN
jgi:hypothetical protein